MKLKITQAGFENFTGQMGVVYFEDGLSAVDVIPAAAARLAGIMGCEWEDGSPANVNQMYLDNMHTPAPTSEELAPKAEGQPLSLDMEAIKETAQDTGISYTEDQLAVIADEKGIGGLREIADPLGLKGNSIRGLIDSILKVAGAPKVE